MTLSVTKQRNDLARRLADSEATLAAMLSGQIDAVVDSGSMTLVLLATAQDALRASEERYRRIVETANEGIWALDDDGTTSFVNGRMASMLGYAIEEMIGRPVAAFVPESHRLITPLAIERGRQGLSHGMDAALIRRDGTILPVWISSAPLSNSAGAPSGALAMVTDRTQARTAEEALRRSEAQYRQIVETTNDGIITVDHDATIVFANHRFCAMLGYEAGEIIGRSAFDLLGTLGKSVATAALKRRAAGFGDSHDSSFRHKNGSEIAVNVAGSPIFGPDGAYVGSLGIIRDVTDQRKLQAQLMVSDRMASVGTLAAGVAHEINNPLAAVMANLEFIAEAVAQVAAHSDAASDPQGIWLRDEIRSPLADARDAAERVRFIVRDLKMFSRAPSEDRAGAVDVEAILDSSLRMAWNEVRHRARLVKNYGGVPLVKANEARLGQVFLNLIVNAAQAMREGGAEDNEIRLRTRLVDDRVVIEVSDTGPGIAPEILSRVFDAFFTTKEIGSGTGLGLAICQRIITDIGGELTVESTVGAGTTFRVSLPLAVSDEPVVPALTVVPLAGRRGRILVVDDEELVVRSVTRMLAREHDVEATTSARYALEICANGREFDLILCDLMMPDMTGMDLHAELTRIAPEQAKRMIFVTGGAFTDKARHFLMEPPKQHIEKPFESANLRAIVRGAVR